VSSVPGQCEEQCGERFEVNKGIVVNIGQGQCVEHWTRAVSEQRARAVSEQCARAVC
jgi:hypothetical protein